LLFAGLRTAAAIFLTTAPGDTFAATYPAEWKPVGLQGITVRSLAATEDLLCAGTQGAGVYCRVLDGMGTGTGWLSNGLPGVTVTWLWIDPLESLVRFAASGGPGNTASLYRTVDGGQNWVRVDGFPHLGGVAPRAYAVDGVAGTSTVFAAGARIWVSHDRGDSWSEALSASGLDCLEVSRADPAAVWSGGETIIFMGFTVRSLDGGATWDLVWDSSSIGDNQTDDVAAHPTTGGLVLTGHEGFVLRTDDDGATFTQVLEAPSRFFLDWDGGNPERAYAAGSPNGGTAHAFVSGDLGSTWHDVTGAALAPRTVFRVEADEKRTGVVYAATDNGVYRFYGGGVPICLAAAGGMDALRLERGACSPTPAGPTTMGDVIAADPLGFLPGDATLFLSEVECLANDEDITLVTLDTPDPAPSRFLAILARTEGEDIYGFSSDGLRRRALVGDCP
jgi:photosystem II stability/assembly factor-like uncharacterized protein